jgi:hypothetical protein
MAFGGKPQKLKTASEAIFSPSPFKYVSVKEEKKNLLLPSSGSLVFHADGCSRFIRDVGI